MHKVTFAELILSLAMPRDRAAAVAGDLVESARGPLRFGCSVLGTLFAAVFRQLSVTFVAKAIGLVLVANLILRTAFVIVLTAGGRMFEQLAWMGPILGVGFLLLAPLWIGRMVGRWLPGRELAAWLASVFFVAATILVWVSGLMTSPTTFWFHAVLSIGQIPTASLLPLLVGLLLARRANLRATAA